MAPRPARTTFCRAGQVRTDAQARVGDGVGNVADKRVAPQEHPRKPRKDLQGPWLAGVTISSRPMRAARAGRLQPRAAAPGGPGAEAARACVWVYAHPYRDPCRVCWCAWHSITVGVVSAACIQYAHPPPAKVCAALLLTRLRLSRPMSCRVSRVVSRVVSWRATRVGTDTGSVPRLDRN